MTNSRPVAKLVKQSPRIGDDRRFESCQAGINSDCSGLRIVHRGKAVAAWKADTQKRDQPDLGNPTGDGEVCAAGPKGETHSRSRARPTANFHTPERVAGHGNGSPHPEGPAVNASGEDYPAPLARLFSATRGASNWQPFSLFRFLHP